MTFKLGMPTLIEKDSIEENVILCNELGLDFVELNMNLPYCMPNSNSPEELLRMKEKYNIEFTLHFPEEIDFACFYEEIRQANISLFQYIATWASKFGVEKINIHLNPGVYFTLPHKKMFVYDKNKELFMEKFKDSLCKIVKIASPLGIKVCIENMQVHSFIESTFKDLCEVSEAHFTWDVGHDAAAGYKIEKIYSKYPHKVSHMHLHDYNGTSDHQILFDGHIPIRDRIKFAKDNDLSVVLETKTVDALKESVKRLKESDNILF
ncbi:sugar phosphate isomerase/epimerase family protein [Haloimpatiens sp. FM7330]|uniref:sugar phosphate isomerase/epimerase family protein n=1 Tax=Haloimpatiens sp. FM7330 TaxID=3298610 RepID=UPI003624D78A